MLPASHGGKKTGAARCSRRLQTQATRKLPTRLGESLPALPEKRKHLAAALRGASCAAPATLSHHLHPRSQRCRTPPPRRPCSTSVGGARVGDIATLEFGGRPFPSETTQSRQCGYAQPHHEQCLSVKVCFPSHAAGSRTLCMRPRRCCASRFHAVRRARLCVSGVLTQQVASVPDAKQRHRHGARVRQPPAAARSPERRRPTRPRCPRRRCHREPAVALQRRGS